MHMYHSTHEIISYITILLVPGPCFMIDPVSKFLLINQLSFPYHIYIYI